MVSDNKALNKQQTALRQLMTSGGDHGQAIALFLKQHAQLHSAEMAGTDLWSYEDELLDDIPPDQATRIPANDEHSIAWVMWHIARIEDVAMNMLVAGEEQVLLRDGWQARLAIRPQDTGNAMPPPAVAKVSAEIDYQSLRAYRIAVGRQTRTIVRGLTAQDLRKQVDTNRLDKVLSVGAVVPQAQAVIDYWSKRTIAGLLLMPATRHNLVHLNEVVRLKSRLA
jgi:hypothetical protein